MEVAEDAFLLSLLRPLASVNPVVADRRKKEPRSKRQRTTAELDCSNPLANSPETRPEGNG